MVASAASTTLNGRAGGDGLRTVSYGELLTLELDSARSVIERLIAEVTGAILGGPANVGKTWVALDQARAVAAGVEWLGRFATTQGTVLFVDEESHLPGVMARARMLEQGNPLGADLPLHFAVGWGIRLDSRSVERLDRLLTEYRPSLVIFDSLTRVHGADENHAGQMADVFGNAKALMRHHGAAFLFTDHVRKRGLINEPEEMLRGSTEKRAWPDCILSVEPDGRDPSSLVVRHTKARHGRKLDPFVVKIDVDEAEGTARLVHAGEASTDQATRGHDIVQAIHALQAQLGPDGADATTAAAWLGCSPDTVRRHVVKLAAAGLVAVRKAEASSKGGPRRDVYDVLGGEDR